MALPTGEYVSAPMTSADPFNTETEAPTEQDELISCQLSCPVHNHPTGACTRGKVICCHRHHHGHKKSPDHNN